MAKVGFVSLGCAKNLVDTEVMLGLLARDGHEITSSQEEAEIIVVNTCGFIQSAKQESVDAILDMAQQKAVGNCRKLIVAGCLVENHRRDILEQIPEVDAVIGTHEIPGIVNACSRASQTLPQYEARELYLYDHSDPRILTTPGHSAYIKVAEGCDHPCTFCVIPQLRGRFRSRPMHSVLEEARQVAARGVKEINLVAQDTTMYGCDWGNPRGLAELIRKLGEVDGISWIRFLYAYPNRIYSELLESVSETSAACKYIDVPLQHASSRILKLMKRGGNRHSLSSLMSRIRSAIPGVVVRTTMIVGFPGESEEDFNELMEFTREARFDRLGVFTYSDEDNAASYVLEGKIPEQVKEERKSRLMVQQKRISQEKNQTLVGKTLPVLLEGVSRQSEHLWEGRLSTQAPEIDGLVYLNEGITARTRPGHIVPVRITEAHPYDLVGAVLS